MYNNEHLAQIGRGICHKCYIQRGYRYQYLSKNCVKSGNYLIKLYQSIVLLYQFGKFCNNFVIVACNFIHFFSKSAIFYSCKNVRHNLMNYLKKRNSICKEKKKKKKRDVINFCNNIHYRRKSFMTFVIESEQTRIVNYMKKEKKFRRSIYSILLFNRNSRVCNIII